MMGRRIFFTALLLAGAIGGFLGAAPMPAGPLNPFGIVFLALSGVIWFGWSVIPDIYAYHEERARTGRLRVDLIVLRMAPVLTMRSDRGKKPF
jgi:hypothetical protein